MSNVGKFEAVGSIAKSPDSDEELCLFVYHPRKGEHTEQFAQSLIGRVSENGWRILNVGVATEQPFKGKILCHAIRLLPKEEEKNESDTNTIRRT